MKTKQIEIILAVVSVLLFAGAPAKAINIDDGQNHVFSDATYQNDIVDIDAVVANNPGTHVQVVDGAQVFWIGASHYSTIQIDGGTFYWGLSSSDNASITVNGGTAGSLLASGQSLIEMNGGTIQTRIAAFDYSTINIRGGVFSQLSIDRLMTDHGGTIYLYGTNFTVGGQQLHNGDSLRDYGIISGSDLTGTLNGTLANGPSFSVPFSFVGNVQSGDIIVVPEPATLALLALGGLVLRKKQSKILP